MRQRWRQDYAKGGSGRGAGNGQPLPGREVSSHTFPLQGGQGEDGFCIALEMAQGKRVFNRMEEAEKA